MTEKDMEDVLQIREALDELRQKLHVSRFLRNVRRVGCDHA